LPVQFSSFDNLPCYRLLEQLSFLLFPLCLMKVSTAHSNTLSPRFTPSLHQPYLHLLLILRPAKHSRLI
jgi:hypothetical protein